MLKTTDFGADATNLEIKRLADAEGSRVEDVIIVVTIELKNRSPCFVRALRVDNEGGLEFGGQEE